VNPFEGIFLWAKKRSDLWLFLLPGLLLLPGLGGFPYPAGDAPYSDMAVTHFPNVVYLLGALREWQNIPWWSPTILSGYPFVANPLAGIWYPPGWLAYLFPLPAGFNLLVIVHLSWGGLGMYRLLRIEGLSRLAGLIGGLGFMLLPKSYAHYGAGHLTLLYAVVWTPWLLAEERHSRNWNWRPAVILALIALADPRWVMLAGVVWWGYGFTCSHTGEYVKRLKQLALSTGLAVLLAAPLALPLFEYIQHSTRALMQSEDSQVYSLPLIRLLGLVFPDQGGFHEWMAYAGAVILLLAIFALFSRGNWRIKGFWCLCFGISLLFALGSSLPFGAWISQLPGLGWLRVPARALFLTGIAISALAGYGLEGVTTCQIRLRPANWVEIALVGGVATLAGGVWIVSGVFPVEFVWGAIALGLGFLWIQIGVNRKLGRKVWAFGLMLLVIIDLGGVDRSSFTTRSPSQVLLVGATAARYLAQQPGKFRVYSPSYSLPQQTAALFGLELADGVDPLQLASYAKFMDRVSGVPRERYTVTIPPFSTGDPITDNANYQPNPDLLGWLNVAYVAAAYDLHVDGLRLIEQFDDTRIYANERTRPRAWVQPEVKISEGDFKPVEVYDWEPDRIEVHAIGPGVLVFSELAYPGWRARVDGESRPMMTIEGLLRGVILPAGSHQVVLDYWPMSLYTGLVLFSIGVGLIVLLQLRKWLLSIGARSAGNK